MKNSGSFKKLLTAAEDFRDAEEKAYAYRVSSDGRAYYDEIPQRRRNDGW